MESQSRMRSIRGLGSAVVVVLVVLVAVQAAHVIVRWISYQAVVARLVQRSITHAEYVRAGRFGVAVEAALVVAIGMLMVLTWVLLTVWMWRARANVDLSGAPQRLSPGWIVGGWICPVVNLWFLALALDDIQRRHRDRCAPSIRAQ